MKLTDRIFETVFRHDYTRIAREDLSASSRKDSRNDVFTIPLSRDPNSIFSLVSILHPTGVNYLFVWLSDKTLSIAKEKKTNNGHRKWSFLSA